MKIDVINSLKGIVLLFVLFNLQQPLSAQQDVNGNILRLCDQGDFFAPVPNGDCEPESIRVKFDDPECYSAYLDMAFYVVDLYDNPVLGQTYDWPSKKYPEMHLQYEYEPGVWLYTDPVLEWEYIDNVFGHNLFQGRFKIQPAFLDGALNCRESISESYFDFRALIVRKQSFTTYSLYPIHYFAGPDEIMSCEVFQENCGYCSPATQPPYCDGGTDEPVYNLTACVDCGDCGLSDAQPVPGDGAVRSVDDQKSEAPIVDIYPNPFTENFVVSYSSKHQQSVTLRMMDLDGKVISEKEFAVDRGSNSLEVSTENLSGGLYLIQIMDSHTNQIKQIMKVE